MSTQIAFLFPDVKPDAFDWQGLFRTYPELQIKRLSWRETDPLFGAFVRFLETEGPRSSLDEISWRRQFADHLAYRPNCHFLFMLWLGISHSDTTLPEPEKWLPEKVAADFHHWRRDWEFDRAIMAILPGAEGRPERAPLAFRGIPLESTFNYRIVPHLIAAQRTLSRGKKNV